MTRFRLACPSTRSLSRESSGGWGTWRSARIRDHLQSCASCWAEWVSIKRLADLTRALPIAVCPPEEIEAVRTALLVDSRPARPRSTLRPIWLCAPAAALAIFGAFWLLHGRERALDQFAGRRPDTPSSPLPELHRGIVHAGAAAVFSVVEGQPDEIVRLREGQLTVEVEPLAMAERFRVMTRDAEIEVKGTVFSVVAQDDRLMSVSVVRGLVVVRAQGKDPVTLGPNEQWELLAAGDHISSGHPRRWLDRRIVLRRSAQTTLRTPVPPSSISEPMSLSPAETAFADGWQALRAHRLPDAVSAFARAVAVAGDQPLAEDAWFWMAVCQARIPRHEEARSSLAAFIDRFPRSPRIGEAAAMLGWILMDQGDLDGASRRFATATRDPGGAVRKSANEGLRAVARRRGGSGK